MKFIKYTAALLILISAFVFIFPFQTYEIDLIQSFAVHAMLLYLIAGTVLLIAQQWMLSTTAYSAGITILLFINLHLNSNSNLTYEVQGTAFSVAHFNVLCSNTYYQKTIRQALHAGADVLSFQEVNVEWNRQLLKGLQHAYPYHHYVDGRPHGIAVFSKHPLHNLKTYHWSGVPTLTGDVSLPHTRVHFVTTHTLSPRNEHRFRKRNEHLKHIAHYLKSVKGPALAIGDFNAVPWNYSIIDIKRKTRMEDSRRSITPTFPSSLKLAGIPIDYILHSNDLTCLGFDAVDTIGSDHRGVVGTYLIRKEVSRLTINTRKQHRLQKEAAELAA